LKFIAQTSFLVADHSVAIDGPEHSDAKRLDAPRIQRYPNLRTLDNAL
jgi:hypothetical protein